MVLVDVLVIPKLRLCDFDDLDQLDTADIPGPTVILGEAGCPKGGFALPPITSPPFL
jgi:hypothetical protein